ncbi:protein Hook homolog 3 [Chelonus insularis]|uniref:protein Hook homolog 3 n=1 Tax=Chelonus insularis TaxID=460826 RepID=UPI00158BB8B3|nr:protein Hook homolog 3 [Chelonus insularis]
MSDNQIDSFIKWLSTFDLKAPYATIEAISDGVAISEVLQQISPEWFTDTWKSKIKTNVGSNWRLRVSNLKKIVEAVMEYYSECLNQPLVNFIKPDASKIGEQYDSNELRKLLQLVLGCAINCSNKQQYITSIMQMEETVQQTIMQNIQELEGDMHGSRISLGVSLNLDTTDTSCGSHQKLISDLQLLTEQKEQLEQKCYDLNQQLLVTREEKNLLVSENKKLQKRLEESENTDESIPSLRYSGLRKQIKSLKEEIFKIETSRDDYKLKVELLEKEFSDLQLKYDELQKIAEKANDLKDEVDALRETADKVTKYELTIESYKKKMEDLVDLRRQVKILEDKNIEYAELKKEYEEEIKKGLVIKNHMELCKHQLLECHKKLEEQVSNNDKLDLEIKKLQIKLNLVEREKERLIVERDTLRETNDELKCSQLQPIDNVTSLTMHTNSTPELLARDMKDLFHLKNENKDFKVETLNDQEKLTSRPLYSNDCVSPLYGFQDKIKKETKNCDDTDNKIDKYSDDHNDTNNIDNNIRQQLLLQNKALKTCRMEQEQLILQLDEKETILQTQKQKISALQEALSRKESENIVLEERYKKCIDKAKNVIRSLDPKQNNSCEMMLLRNQITEKQKTIEQIKQSLQEYKLFHEMEERLMISAFYNLGFNNQRKIIDQRLHHFNTEQGNFLFRQRQVQCDVSNSLYKFK